METEYSLKKLIDLLGRNEFALLLRTILDRIPIVVIGHEPAEVDNLTNELITLAPHRHEYIFESDFIEQDEYLQLCQEENDNFDIPRTIFYSPASASARIFQKIENLKGWIIGFSPPDDLSKTEISSQISRIAQDYLIVDLNEMKLSLNGSEKSSLNLHFEKNLINKAIQKTEVAVERMRRVLKKKIKSGPSSEVMGAIMGFGNEEAQIQSNIFNQEIKTFAHAGERAIAILNRISLLRGFGVNTELSGKTLLQTIDYEDVDSERLLQFVQAEYGVDFSDCIKGGRITHVGDRIDGFWG